MFTHIFIYFSLEVTAQQMYLDLGNATIEYEEFLILWITLIVGLISLNLYLGKDFWLRLLFKKASKKKSTDNKIKSTEQIASGSVATANNSPSSPRIIYVTQDPQSRQGTLASFINFLRKNLAQILVNALLIYVVISGINTFFLSESKIMQINGLEYRMTSSTSNNSNSNNNDNNSSSSSTAKAFWTDMSEPIEIVFDRPILIGQAKLDITPQVDFQAEYLANRPGSSFIRKLKLTPQETVFPGVEIQVYISGTYSLLGVEENNDYYIEFNSSTYEDPVSVSPNTGDTQVSPEESIVLQFTKNQEDYTLWEFEAEPSIKGDLAWEGTQLKLIPETPLSRDTEYEIKFFRQFVKRLTVDNRISQVSQSDRKKVTTLKFKTFGAFNVEDYSPKGDSARIDANIKIKFIIPPDKLSLENSISIIPDVKGSWRWPSADTVYYLLDEPLQKDTEYQVHIKKGVQLTNGTTSSEPIVLNLSTIGEVEILGSNPSHLAQNIKVDRDLEVIFNQEIDKKSAENKFSLMPFVNGEITWRDENNKDGSSTQTLIFTPAQNLNFNTTYTIEFDQGIKSIYGIDSQEEFVIKFTTSDETFELAVPLIRQEEQFECNVTATSMVLKYYGIEKSKEEIYAALPKDPTPYNEAANTWGNPHEGFVGDITGEEKGYGIYWEPIIDYINSNFGPSTSHKLEAKAHRNWNLKALLTEVKEEQAPVIVWWQNGRSTPTDISWNTHDGEYIKAVNGMHSEVVIGFVGPIDDPKYILLNDPWRGHRQMPIAEFKALWGYFDNTSVSTKSI